jgi:hypothetical protein
MLKFYTNEDSYYVFYEACKSGFLVKEIYMQSLVVYKLLYKEVAYYFYDYPSYYV